MKIERKWLWNRLKAMSISEVMHRVYKLVRYSVDASLYRYKLAIPSGRQVQLADTSLFGDQAAVSTGLAPSTQEMSVYRSQWLNNALYLFDTQAPVQLSEPVQWLTDPKTGIQTPQQFGRSIDYRDDQSVGEIKYLWELGRHQFLVPMAVCVASNGDTDVRDKLASHLASWLAQNPVGLGIHWCSALELALRLISWSHIHGILQRGGMPNGVFDLDVDTSDLKSHIYAQVKFIAGNYSRHSSANNHLTGELTGVWMACNVFDLGAQGTRWRASAYAELNREIRLQTHDDGVNKEQAVYYHLWSLEYFWLIWCVAKRYEQPVSTEFEQRIVAMYVFLSAMCADTAYPSQIGDADGGVVSRFSPDATENVYSSLLDAISHTLNGEQHSAADVYSKRYWYSQIVAGINTGSLVACYQNSGAKIQPVDAFDSGGYYLLRGDDCRLMFKAGPFGYLSTGAHGHADALSVTLAIDEQWWLIDPGTYTYHSSGAWRNYFRSTLAHNTMGVNGQDQSEIAGDFLWAKKTHAQVTDIKRQSASSGEYLSAVSGTHSGYQSEGVVHTRTVSCDGQHSFELQDRVALESSAEGIELQLSFHFHPSVTLRQLDTHHWLATRQDSEASLMLELPAQFHWSVVRGSTDPIAGWYSETYGVKSACNMLAGKLELSSTNPSNNDIYKTVMVVREAGDAPYTVGSDGVAI